MIHTPIPHSLPSPPPSALSSPHSISPSIDTHTAHDLPRPLIDLSSPQNPNTPSYLELPNPSPILPSSSLVPEISSSSPPSPQLSPHPMVTRSKAHIFCPKKHIDGTISWPPP